MNIAGKLSLLILMVAIVPIAAHADFSVPVQGVHCGSCYGGTYLLNFVGNNSGTTFTVTLTIQTPTDPTSVVFGQYISGVGFGDGKAIASVTPVSTSFGGTWSTVFGNINSSGACDGSPGNKVCSQQNSNTPPFQFALANGSTYTWTWVVTFTTPGLDINLADIHIQAQYQDAGGSNGHIVSENGLAVAEPSTAAMLGLGLALVGFRIRRKA